MARAKKSSSRKGTRSKATQAKKKSRKGFEEIWSSVGRRLVKELKAERGWDQKTFLARLDEAGDLPAKVLDFAKRLFPMIAVPAAVPEIRTPSSISCEEKEAPAFDSSAEEFWDTRESDTSPASLVP